MKIQLAFLAGILTFAACATALDDHFLVYPSKDCAVDPKTNKCQSLKTLCEPKPNPSGGIDYQCEGFTNTQMKAVEEEKQRLEVELKDCQAQHQ